MPRDFSTYSPRRCWPPTSSFASTIQVSISDEMVVSVRSMSVMPGREARQHRRDVLGLQVIDHAREHRLDVGVGADRHQVGHRVDDDHGRLEVRHDLVHRHEMGLEPVARRPVGVELQQSGRHPRLEVDADGAHVPEELLRRLLEEKAQAALAAAARRVEKVRRQARLPGAGRCRRRAPCCRGSTPCRRASRRGAAMPADMRSSGAACCSAIEDTGSTLMPSASMRNGYSFVPWWEPRYLTTRRRRVET